MDNEFGMDHDIRMGETVVGASCDLCPMFCRSHSTWSSTLVYTPEQIAVKDGQRSGTKKGQRSIWSPGLPPRLPQSFSPKDTIPSRTFGLDIVADEIQKIET